MIAKLIAELISVNNDGVQYYPVTGSRKKTHKDGFCTFHAFSNAVRTGSAEGIVPAALIWHVNIQVYEDVP